jgi:hypothetical protein
MSDLGQIEASIRQHTRRAAMHRLAEGVRVGANFMAEMMKQAVSVPAPGEEGSPLGKHRRGGRTGVYRVGKPPYTRSGEGMESIGFQILSMDYEAGMIVFGFGVDASAPGGNGLPSYLLAHNSGIAYPTVGNGPKTVLKRPWRKPTFEKYRNDMFAAIVQVARGTL